MNYKKKYLTSNYLENYKQTLKLNKNQKDILIGVLLGDATMATRAGRPILRIKFEQQTKFKLYIDHLYEVFEPFVGSQKRTTPRFKESTMVSFWFATYQHNSFKYYYDLFYPKQSCVELNNKRSKRVPKQIDQLLTPKALAYWFMDDGTCKKMPNGILLYGLSTQGFSYKDQKLLVFTLKKKFNLNISIHKSGIYFKLYIRSNSSKKFYDLVKPYIQPCFCYKLGIKSRSDYTAD
jgi:hypothetical protein